MATTSMGHANLTRATLTKATISNAEMDNMTVAGANYGPARDACGQGRKGSQACRTSGWASRGSVVAPPD